MTNLEHSMQKYDAGSQLVPYSIPLADFQSTPPTNPQQYDVSTRITRETFISVISDSFGKSRGNRASQFLFFEWLSENNGFDYTSSIGNYNTADGWKCFSEQELEMIFSDFLSIPRHHTADMYLYLKGHETQPKTSSLKYVGNAMDMEINRFGDQKIYHPKFKGLINPRLNVFDLYRLVSIIPSDEPLKGMSIPRLEQLISSHIKTWKEMDFNSRMDWSLQIMKEFDSSE